MLKKLLTKSLLVAAGLLGGMNAWAYDVPDGYEIKTVYIGTNNGDGTVSSDGFNYESVPGTWVAQDANAAVAIGNVTAVANVAVGSTPESQPTYVDGKTLQLTVSGTNWTEHWARYTLADAVSTGKLIFRADMYQANSPTYIRFLDADGNELLKFGFNNGKDDRYYLYYVNGAGTGSNCDMHTTYRSYHGFSIEDLVLDMTTGSVSFYLDYINTNSSNQRAQVTNTKNITFGAGKSVKYFEIGSTVNGSQIVHYDNIQFYHVTEAGKNNYEIYARAGETNLQLLASGQKAKDEEYSATGLPLVVKYNNQYYTLDDANVTNYATQTYTMGDADETKYITYTLDESIVHFEEGESLSTNKYTGNYSGGYAANYRASGDMNHLNKFNTTVISETGVYKADIYVTGGIANGRAYGVYKVENEALVNVGSISFSSNKLASTGLYSTPNFRVESGTTLYTGGTSNTLDIDYLIIRKVDLSAETTAFNALKDYADALVAVANDNASANSALTTAISTQAAAVEAATTAEAITTATNTLKAAMLTYIGAANPIGANEFDLEFMIVNPGMEVDGGTTAWKKDVTGWTRCATVTNYRPIAITSFENNTSGAFTGTYAYENWHQAGLVGQMKQTISDMPDGVYKVQLGVFVESLNGQFAYAKSNGVTYKYSLTVGNATEDATIYVPVTGGSLEIGLDMNGAGVAWAAIDNARVHKVNYSVSKPVSSFGWATYCSPYALDFSGEISNLTDAYIITGGENGYVTTNSVKGGTVPANTGLLLKGTEGTVTIPVAASSSTDVSANKLIGVTSPTVIDAKTGYVLMNDDTDGFGFYKNASDFEVGANTAYLPSDFDSNAAGMRFFGFFDDDDATAIKGVESDTAENGAIYNLAGQRVGKDYKGIVIKNGKKFMNK